MPAVSVLPLGNTPVTSVTSPTSHMMEKMPAPGGVKGMGSAPKNDDGDSGHKGTVHDSTPDASKDESKSAKPSDMEKKDSGSAGGTVSPSTSTNSYPQALPAHLTPQQPGYYVAYQSQVTPEPPSPAGPTGTTVYDVGSFLQQPTGFHSSPFAAHQYGANPSQQQQAPNSPSQNTSVGMAGVPPASPLFPSMSGQANAGLLDQPRVVDASMQQRGAPLSPGPPYLATPPTPTMYPGMGGYANLNPNGASANGNNNNSPDDFKGWFDNRNPQSGYPHNSPQISAQGIPIPYVPGMPRTANIAGRTYSFEDTMLPPSAESQQQQGSQQEQNANFSPYNGSQGNPGAPGTLFAHQQPWGYGGPPPDMYGATASPLQPRPTMAYPGMPGAPPRHHGPPNMGQYGGQYYPATSPGPPIQTTASNKGPDGANLFIFHIPNHFTNLDMYQLFCPYGNLLSVRIMVEKDTGRSRGFGFVSYDSPDAAALAIKELNGFAIGNKRLKVQHKQIRPSDQHHERHALHHNQGGYDNNYGGGGYARGTMSASLPPSGPMPMDGGWCNNRAPQGDGVEASTVPPPHGGQTPPSDQPSGPAEEAGQSSPLSSLEPLRQTLPDVGGNGDKLK